MITILNDFAIGALICLAPIFFYKMRKKDKLLEEKIVRWEDWDE